LFATVATPEEEYKMSYNNYQRDALNIIYS